ncbi:MAG: hypothetical protein E7185_07545 [Erysipelotrichaceae bacterium]|nr:hypothetical protein [Erysipelotrichaceae bacterium]
MSKEKEIRYFIEHQLVRKWFFEEGKQFTGTLAEHNEIFPRMVRQIFYENGCEYPYTDDQFTVAALHLEGDIYCISIGMPEPEYEGECHQILMIFDRSFSSQAYFTIEYGQSLIEDQTLRYCCEWTEKGEHLNYGQCSEDTLECIRQCVQIYVTNNKEAE